MRELSFAKEWYHHWVAIFIICFAGAISITILFRSPLIGLSLVGALFFFILWISNSGERHVNSLKNQQFPPNLDIKNRDHDAFIIIHSMGSFSVGLYAGLSYLVPYYVNNQFPFKIYHCYNPHEFLEVLKNPHAKYIWVFGHGWRGGVSFKWECSFKDKILRRQNKTRFSYATISKITDPFPCKLFIAQFHCNHIEKKFEHNESLIEILLDPSNQSKYYITEGMTHAFSVWFAIRNLRHQIMREKIREEDGSNDLEEGCNRGC